MFGIYSLKSLRVFWYIVTVVLPGCWQGFVGEKRRKKAEVNSIAMLCVERIELSQRVFSTVLAHVQQAQECSGKEAIFSSSGYHERSAVWNILYLMIFSLMVGQDKQFQWFWLSWVISKPKIYHCKPSNFGFWTATWTKQSNLKTEYWSFW